MPLLSMNFLVSFGISSTSKFPKCVFVLIFEYKEILLLPMSEYLSRFITYSPSFNLLGKLSRE